MPKSMRITIAVMSLLIMILVAVVACTGSESRNVYVIDERKFVLPEITSVPMPVEDVEATPRPTTHKDEFWGSDLHWMAMALELESGVSWPDWTILMIADVINHRVASPNHPDTIEGVLLEEGQYEPFFPPFDLFMPQERYIWLAQRSLGGETYLRDMAIQYQALFPQGETTILTYYDESLGTTTFFCK